MFTIYKATNKIYPEKCYIGYDSNWPERKWAHYSESFNLNKKKYKSWWYSFHIALREFEKENFDWEIIHTSTSLEEIKCMETIYILVYNSHYKNGNGYNMTSGGDGSTGIKRTDNWKKNHSIKMSKSGNPWFGKRGKEIPWFGKKISNYVLEKRKNKLSKNWQLIDPLGKIYNIKNLSNFCRENNLHPGNLITHGKSKGWTCSRN